MTIPNEDEPIELVRAACNVKNQLSVLEEGK